jgi:Predicted xylanase/chitin deacetylase
MSRVKLRFGWMLRPQLFVGFLAICLCVGALGNISRATYNEMYSTLAPRPSVKGAATAQPLPDCGRIPCIALSFDDGPNAAVTPRVLDILASEHVKATFFLIGKHVPGNEPLLRRMHDEGHEIGNHSWDHPDFTTLTPGQMDNELATTQQVIANAGVPLPHLFRPPYGAVNDIVRSHAAGMAIVRWDIDPADWEVLDAGKVQQAILAQARPGGIILMHDIYPSTADALMPVIEQLKGHYQFVTVSQLMSFAPGDQGQYFGRWRPE